jgi:hypothetical protein
LKMTAFWDAAPFIIVKVDRRFRGVYCLHHQGGSFRRTKIQIVVTLRRD